jgi:hypothetical protein
LCTSNQLSVEVGKVIEENELRDLSGFSRTRFTNKNKNLGLMEEVEKLLTLLEKLATLK